ncbi:MAG TPA: cytochrome c maturation protein CcmE [Gammaproteobacteria bacterium]|nr:cytochrome c maturation protein CcmE [Gammaproteobacteria bacterium]
MTPRRQRLLVVVGILAGTAIGVGVALKAFSGNLLYYYTPTQTLEKNLGPKRVFRLGGLVEKGSVKRQPGSLTVRFVVTDNRRSIPVIFTGVLPDLFRPGQGVIANGHMGPGGVFVANDVLAKHDSKYMPLKLYNKENGTVYRKPGSMDAGAGGRGS